MRSIILTTLFLIPLFGFASFPVNKTTLSDTIKSSTLILNGTTIKIKKETIENNKNGFQKHTYNQQKNNQKNNYKSLFEMLSSFFLVLGIISIIIATQVANNSTQFISTQYLSALVWLQVGIYSIGLSFLIFLFYAIIDLFKKN